MWHTTEIANIMAKLIEKRGYAVFQERKACVALFGDLLWKYEREKQIFQMLFQAGLGNAMDDMPYKTEQELKIGLSRIDAFLQKQGLSLDVRIHVVDIIHKAIAQSDTLIEINMLQPNITKSYSELHFRLSIPALQEYAERLEFSTKYMYKELGMNIDTVFEKAVFTDREHTVLESKMNYCLLPHKKNRTIKIIIPNEENNIFLEMLQ